MIIVYLALTTALAALALGVLVRSFLQGTTLVNSVALIELIWLLVSMAALWFLPLSPAAALVPQFIIASTLGLGVAYARWSNGQQEVDPEFYPRWYRYAALLYNLILLLLAAYALQNYCADGCALALHAEQKVWLPAIGVLVVLIVATHLGGKSLTSRGIDQWHNQALDAIIAHPTCEATFGQITDVYFMEEESAWYNERDVLAYWIEGNKASGHLVARFTSKDDKELLQDGHIQLESGKAIAITSENLSA